MTLDESFLLSIREESLRDDGLEDDTPRLIYADWLMEQEEPWRVERGEFIRIQCELVRLAESDPRRDKLRQREQTLLERNWEAWVGPLRRLLGIGSSVADAWLRGAYKAGAVCKFRRGFVETLSLHARTFLTVAEQLVRLTPLRRLELIRAGSLAGSLANCPVLHGIQCLWFSDYFVDPIDSTAIRTLTASPHLRHLSVLGLHRNNIGDAGVALLAGSTNLPGLRRLELAHNGISNEGVRALTGSPLLSQLRCLDLEGNHITPEGQRLLLASPYLPSAGILRLDGNET